MGYAGLPSGLLQERKERTLRRSKMFRSCKSVQLEKGSGERDEMPATSDPDERKRLEGLYEGLRIRLLDLSRKNQLLNNNLRPRSKRSIQVIGCSLEDAHRRLAIDEATLKVSALPHPDAIPTDERTEEFRAAFDRAKSTDVEYLTALEALESTGRDDDAALEKLEREYEIASVRISNFHRARPARI